MTWRVWYSAIGAGQTPRRPCCVRDPEGKTYLAASVAFDDGVTVFLEEGFRDLPGGPRMIVAAETVAMADFVEYTP